MTVTEPIALIRRQSVCSAIHGTIIDRTQNIDLDCNDNWAGYEGANANTARSKTAYQGRSPANIDAIPPPVLACRLPLTRCHGCLLLALRIALNAGDVKGDVKRKELRGAAMV